jgi:hypothetical protein
MLLVLHAHSSGHRQLGLAQFLLRRRYGQGSCNAGTISLINIMRMFAVYCAVNDPGHVYRYDLLTGSEVARILTGQCPGWTLEMSKAITKTCDIKLEC